MSKHRLIFEDSNCSEFVIETFLNKQNEISISLKFENDPELVISLDKSTAIKFAKTLRTEINKIED